MKKELMKIATKQFKWWIHNINTNRAEALNYAIEIFKHAYECGYITVKEKKELILSLPFETFLNKELKK